jgi:hypothetical protein
MANRIKKDTYVRIKSVVLEAGRRAGNIPEETGSVPFLMWNKGFLQHAAELGEEVTIITRTGRYETGVLEEADPQYELGYGKFVPEVLRIGSDARKMLRGDDSL